MHLCISPTSHALLLRKSSDFQRHKSTASPRTDISPKFEGEPTTSPAVVRAYIKYKSAAAGDPNKLVITAEKAKKLVRDRRVNRTEADHEARPRRRCDGHDRSVSVQHWRTARQIAASAGRQGRTGHAGRHRKRGGSHHGDRLPSISREPSGKLSARKNSPVCFPWPRTSNRSRPLALHWSPRHCSPTSISLPRTRRLGSRTAPMADSFTITRALVGMVCRPQCSPRIGRWVHCRSRQGNGGSAVGHRQPQPPRPHSGGSTRHAGSGQPHRLPGTAAALRVQQGHY